MSLKGPFPANLELSEEEGWLLLEALANSTRMHKDTGRESEFDKMYAKILMACGDD